MRSRRDQRLKPARCQIQHHYDEEWVQGPGEGISPDAYGGVDPGIVGIVRMVPHGHQVSFAISHAGIAIEKNTVVTGPEEDDGMAADTQRSQGVTGEAHDPQGSL